MIQLIQKASNLLARRRSVYSTLIGIILLTLPCYAIGAIALMITPRNNTTQPTPQLTTTATLIVRDALNPVASPLATLSELPTQLALPAPTLAPGATATVTPTLEPSATVTTTPTPASVPINAIPGKPGKHGKPGK
jgi:hypothetical protein